MDFIPPYDQVGVTPPGPWKNAAPQAGTKGSIVNADVFPAVQNEILNVQDEAGLTRDVGNDAQLLQAIRSGKLTYFPDTGTADALVVSPRTSIPSLGAGLELAVLKGADANTTPTPTLAVGALSLPIVREDGSALAKGDLPPGCLFTVRSDGTHFRVQGLRPSNISTALPDSQVWHFGGAAGPSTAYTVTLSPVPTDLTKPFCMRVVVPEPNGVNPTLDFGFGPKRILLDNTGEQLAGGEMNLFADLTWDGNSTLFLMNPASSAGSGKVGTTPIGTYLAYKTFTSSGTFVVDAACHALNVVDFWAPGGGGGNGNGSVGAGGGGGEYMSGAYSVSPGETITVTIAAPGGPEQTAGDSSISGSVSGLICTVKGGQGASGNTAGGGSGFGTGGQLRIPGLGGTNGSTPGGGNVFTGTGGASFASGYGITAGLGVTTAQQQSFQAGVGGAGGGNANGQGGYGGGPSFCILQQVIGG